MGSGASSLSQALVVTQIGISLLMLVAAGLFVRTLSNLQSIQLGFNREDLLLFQMNARQAGHKDPEIITFYSELQKRFAAIPGVRGASASHHPLLGQGTWAEASCRSDRSRNPVLHSYSDDRTRILFDDADPDAAGTRVRRSRPARLAGGRWSSARPTSRSTLAIGIRSANISRFRVVRL